MITKTASSGLFLAVLSGCSTHHWAPVASSHLPPPVAQPVLHTSRIVIDIEKTTDETQCVVDETHHPVCFYNVRPSIKSGLVRSLWPSFPEVVVGRASDVLPGDYLLQVDVELDALPPDETGPGWSTGARGRFRLMRDGQVLAEETTAARSRSHFAYGATLGEGATEVVDATIQHIAHALFAVAETRPDTHAALPRVAAQKYSSPPTAAEAPTSQSAELETKAAPLAKSQAEPDKLGSRR